MGLGTVPNRSGCFPSTIDPRVTSRPSGVSLCSRQWPAVGEEQRRYLPSRSGCRRSGVRTTLGGRSCGLPLSGSSLLGHTGNCATWDNVHTDRVYAAYHFHVRLTQSDSRACKVVRWSRWAADCAVSSPPFRQRGTHPITPAPHNFACPLASLCLGRRFRSFGSENGLQAGRLESADPVPASRCRRRAPWQGWPEMARPGKR